MGAKSAARPPPNNSNKNKPTQTQAAARPPKPLEFAPRARKPAPRPARAAAAAPPPPPPPNAATTLSRARRIPLYAALGVASATGLYVAFLAHSLLRPYEPAYAVPADVADRYDSNAVRFDADVDSMERKTGIVRLRRQLAARARGDVLEASAGTGRNSAFYDGGKVRRLVLLDRSGAMLAEARRKWLEIKREGGRAARVRDVEFRAASALDRIPGPGGDAAARFDTVVQTMGLCSTHEPELLLRRLGDAVKDDGRIFLLEHGRGWYGWLNGWLDRSAPGHADAHGCWWNKDVGAIVERSGLEVVEISRPWYHLGTTWWVELKRASEAETPHTRNRLRFSTLLALLPQR
ncbi:uncharacterized protein K452DRAFT_354166 [Aplosporella prunicola CBS 121167]|uniref:Methyltransferase type 11 domain-containing protein n=1 Tax=Aplosporella prunicola CBS 121167 TaxID=1176127 RepID=A0A6A6AY84_9PEZI|nr:uncharacterized protein K452DRAFT_354166 [Aplosporella prunicola CBS 121167]KAF2135924.1 hypothetical protein K452DRAFT_354166 [Aplosporella prunicola CBS 121167]